MAVRITTLGRFAATKADDPAWAPPKGSLLRAVLVLVAVQREISRAQLIEWLWPGVATEPALHRLRNVVERLGDVFGDPWRQVVRGAETLTAPASLIVDADEFSRFASVQRNTRALELYHGPFLAGLTIPRGASGFERWVEDTRAALAMKFRATLKGRVEDLCNAGDLRAALEATEVWLQGDPSDYAPQVARLRILRDLGERRPALQLARQLASRFEREKVRPASQVTALLDLIERGDFPDRPPLDVGVHPFRARPSWTRVAVLPFRDESPDVESAHGEQLAAEIKFALRNVPGLEIPDIEYTPGADRGRFATPDLAASLGVTHVLTGTVVAADHSYSSRFELSNGSTGAVLWADEFRHHRQEATLKLRDEVPTRVLAALSRDLGLRVEPSPSQASRDVRLSHSALPAPSEAYVEDPGTEDEDAFNAFLKGSRELESRSEAGFDAALAHLQRAVAIDPGFARAQAQIAELYLIRAGLEYADRPAVQLYSLAADAIRLALAADPDLPDAHAAQGNYLMHCEWDWEGAGNAFRKAIALFPRYGSARQWYANYLMYLGDGESAEKAARAALRDQPSAITLQSTLARIHQLRGFHGQAAEEFRDIVEVLDRSTSTRSRVGLAARVALALALLKTGSTREAVTAINVAKTRTHPPDAPLLLGAEAYVAAQVGDTERANDVLERMKRRRATILRRTASHPDGRPLDYMPSEFLAIGYVALGQHEQAIMALEEARDARSQAMSLLKVEPIFEPLRDHEDTALRGRFQALMDEVGLGSAP